MNKSKFTKDFIKGFIIGTACVYFAGMVVFNISEWYIKIPLLLGIYIPLGLFLRKKECVVVDDNEQI